MQVGRLLKPQQFHDVTVTQGYWGATEFEHNYGVSLDPETPRISAASRRGCEARPACEDGHVARGADPHLVSAVMMDRQLRREPLRASHTWFKTWFATQKRRRALPSPLPSRGKRDRHFISNGSGRFWRKAAI